MTDTTADQPPDKVTEIRASEVSIMPAANRNKWRDIGLFLVFVGLGINAFLGWNAESEHKKTLGALAADSKEAIDKANKSMGALQAELDAVKKSAKANDYFKEEMAKEFKSTREMLYKAWLNHSKELEAVKKTVERIEKAATKKME